MSMPIPHSLGATVKYANYSSSSAASNTAIAPRAGYKIRVLGCFLSSAGTLDLTLEDSDGTNRIGPVGATAQYGFVLDPCELGWFETAKDRGVNVLQSQAVQVGGGFIYVEIPVS